MELIKAEGKDRQHQLILGEAIRRGFYTEEVTHELGFPATLLVSPSGRTHLLVQGIPASWTSMQARYLCDLKSLTKSVFEAVRIPSPPSIRFSDLNRSRDAITQFLKSHAPCVCKPVIGDNGVGVEMNISTLAEVEEYLARNSELDDKFLLEKYVKGEDLRIQVIGGRIVAACVREPAYVIGDGNSSLQELVEERRGIIKGQNPNNQLDLDAISMILIEEQGLTLAAIPKQGQKVVLKTVSNIGQGGIPVDVTDRLHPEYSKWVRKVAEFLNTTYFALDIIGNAPEVSPSHGSYAIEINSEPAWLHHTFSEVRTHNLAKVVVDELCNEEVTISAK